MSTIQSTPPANTPDTAYGFVRRNKFRVFIAASLGIHALIGFGWGVPAYIKDQRIKAEQAEQARLLLQQEQAAAAKVAKATDKSLDLARADVTRQLRATYDPLVRELSAPRQEMLWSGVVIALHDPIDVLAKAMGDTATTEQDLRNLQADLSRQLIEVVHTQLAANLGKWTQEDVLAQVQEKLVPLLQTHYRQQLDARAGKPLRDSANAFVKAAATAITKDGIARSRATILTPFAETTFESAFGERTAGRFADALIAQLTPSFAARNLQDPKFSSDIRAQINQLLRSAVLKDASYGTATTNRLENLGSDRDAPEVATAATAFAESVKPATKDKIVEVANDPSTDANLLARAAIKLAGGEEDVAYRIDTMAEHAKEGRTVGGLDGLSDSSMAQMREDALTRTSQIELMDAGGPTDPSFLQSADTQPTTQPAIDPILEAAMQDVWKALRVQFDKIVTTKRTPEQANTLWGRVQDPMTPDVTSFATALLDPSLSKGQLEARRVELDTRFAEFVRRALEQTIEQEMAQKLVDDLKGAAGDKITGAYKDPLKQTIGRELTRAITDGVQQEKRDAVQEFARLKASVDSAAATGTQVQHDVNQSSNRLNKPANQPDATKAEGGNLDKQEKAIAGAIDQVKGATEQTVFRAPGTQQKLDTLKTALDDASHQLKAAADAAATGDAAAAKTATKAAADSTAKVNAAAKDAQAAVTGEIDEAARQYALAARRLTETKGSPTTAPADASATTEPSDAQLTDSVNKEFQKQFHDQALDPLVQEITKRFEKHLKEAGIEDAKSDTSLGDKVKDALAGKVEAKGTQSSEKSDAAAQTPADGSAGAVAASGIDSRATAEADKSAAGKSTQAMDDKVAKMAGDIVKSGVKTATGTLRGQGAIADAVAASGSPDADTKALQGNLAANEKAARAGHGDLLADATGSNSLESLRSKWLAAAQGASAEANAAQSDQGQGQGQGSAAGSAAASSGQGSGAAASAAGNGRQGRGNGRGAGRGSQLPLDLAKLKELEEQSKIRGAVAGAADNRQGATGEANRVMADQAQVVAAVLRPSTPPQMQVKNGEPFEPKFKSIRFAAIPFLNKPFHIDGDVEKWKDVPALDLLPERFDGKRLAGLRIEQKLTAKAAWDSSGLYFLVTVIDANNKIDLPPGASSFWNGDVVEVWIDMLNTKERRRARGTGQQFWCWPFGSAQDAAMTGGESVIEKQNYGYYQMGASDLGRVTRKTDDGYIVEFHIPAKRLRDAELVAGKIVGLNLNVETGTQLQYYWASSKAVETFTRPDTWGDILLGGADGTLEIPAKLTGEGTAAEAHETRNAFVIGEPLRLRVTDRDMNLNSSYRDKVAVTVRNPRGDQTVAVLEETTPDSGVFEGALRTGLEMGTAVPATLSVYDGESVTVTYIDQARANGARNASVTYKVRAALPLTTSYAVQQ